MKIIVKVIPNFRPRRIGLWPTTKIKKEPEDSLRVYIKSPAKEGKANQELIRLLSDYFNVSKTYIQIKSGQKSRNKIIIIDRL